MYYLDGNVEYHDIHPKDLWVYNKLQLCRVLGYKCGPVGSDVPEPNFYIVKPAINFMGMCRHARIVWLDGSTDHFHPGEFWCEVFEGEHLSVDYQNGECKLTVKGYRSPEKPLYKWDKWEKIDKKVDFPEILQDLEGNYEWINCEFIDGHLIEAHMRPNPDFRHGNVIAIPNWGDINQYRECELKKNYKYVDDPDYKRKGFWID